MAEDAIHAACDAKEFSTAITEALRTYGSELHGYLIAMTRDEVKASEVFSMAVEDLWKGLPTFRWDCTFRTWSYAITRHALVRYRRDPFKRRAVPVADQLLSDLVAEARSRTQTFLRTETKDKLAEVRASLDPDDQTLLILRINRGLAWREIARVMSADEPVPDLERYAATLRKRFDRLKDELRERMRPDEPG